MHPEGIFAPHRYLVGALLAVAQDNPLSPAIYRDDLYRSISTSDLFRPDHKFSPDVFDRALVDCMNWGLISASFKQGKADHLAISPLGTYFMTVDREMRVGRQRPQILALPDGADGSVFMIQMGYEEVRKRLPLNPYRNQISAYTLAVPASEIFDRLDTAIEAIRMSNSLDAEFKAAVLEKLDDGRRRFKAGPITIAILAALILNPLQDAWNAVTEEIFKPQIEAAVSYIKKVTGI